MFYGSKKHKWYDIMSKWECLLPTSFQLWYIMCYLDVFNLTSSSPASPGDLLGSYSVTTMRDSMGSGEGVSQWVFKAGAGQLHSRSGRGCEGCVGGAWLPQGAGGSAEGQGVAWQGNMVPLHKDWQPLLHQMGTSGGIAPKTQEQIAE